MKIWLITQHEHFDSIAFGPDFTPEAYVSKDRAERRLAELEEDLGEHSGCYYSMTDIELREEE